MKISELLKQFEDFEDEIMPCILEQVGKELEAIAPVKFQFYPQSSYMEVTFDGPDGRRFDVEQHSDVFTVITAKDFTNENTYKHEFFTGTMDAKRVARKVLAVAKRLLGETLDEAIEVTPHLEDTIEEVMDTFSKTQNDEDHVAPHIIRIFDFKRRIAELEDKPDREVGDILYKLGYPVSYNPFGYGWDVVADKAMSAEEFQTYMNYLEQKEAPMDEDIDRIQVGDKVLRKYDQSKRVGVVKKHINNDVWEIEYPENGFDPARTDRHYEDELVKVQESVDNSELLQSANEIKTEVEDEIKRLYNDDSLDYIMVESRIKDGNIIIEVRAELDYEDMTNLADKLDPIIRAWDSEAYFDQVDGGIMEALVNIKVDESMNEDELYHQKEMTEFSEDLEKSLAEELNRLDADRQEYDLRTVLSNVLDEVKPRHPYFNTLPKHVQKDLVSEVYELAESGNLQR